MKLPKNFLWGAAASGPQTEGSTDKEHESIWEGWYRKEPQRFFQNISNHVVVDTYNKYLNDIELMKKAGFNSFRTSIQWSRLIVDFETGETDPKAVSFYRNYFKAMLDNGIEPIINLYHFDMPMILQEKYGGFENKHVVDLYLIYAEKCFDLFGDLVSKFTTFNEPIVPVEGGYLYDFHYPNKKNTTLAVQVAYNIILAHSLTVKKFRSKYPEKEIGIILNLTPTYVNEETQENLESSKMADIIFNRSFLDPIILGKFPKELVSELTKYNALPDYSNEELYIIFESTIDFLGVNYYVPRRVGARKNKEFLENEFHPDRYFENVIDVSARFNPYRDNNEIRPSAIYDIAMRLKEEYGNIPWYIAELGIAMDLRSEGDVIEGVIDDSYRINLLEEHLLELKKSIDEGANCFGLHLWTFIDNWSWTNTFKRRYGLYRLDLKTGDRIPKKSQKWFKQISDQNKFR